MTTFKPNKLGIAVMVAVPVIIGIAAFFIAKERKKKDTPAKK